MENKKLYDVNWAQKVYKSLEGKYPRGCKTMDRLYKIDAKKAISYIREDQPRWEAYKKCVKYIQKGGRSAHKLVNDHAINTFLHWIMSETYKEMFPKDFFDRLPD